MEVEQIPVATQTAEQCEDQKTEAPPVVPPHVIMPPPLAFQPCVPYTIVAPEEVGIMALGAVQRNDPYTLFQLLQPFRCVPRLLMLAARIGHYTCVEALLAAGVNPNIADDCGRTPLMFAAQENHAEVVGCFILGGACVNQVDSQLQTALHYSIHSGAMVAINALIAANADVKSADVYGRTPLMLAAAHGNMVILNRLLASGASISTQNLQGRTALHYSAANGHVDACTALIAADINGDEKDLGGETALMLAVRNNRTNVVQTLITYQCHVNIRDAWLQSIYHIAAEHNQLACAQLIMIPHANLDAPDGSGNTPLICALRNKHAKFAQLLLEHGADNSKPDSGKRTPVWWAVKQSFLDLLKGMIEENADHYTPGQMVDDRDADHQFYTPFELALLQSQPDVLLVLSAAGGRQPRRVSDWFAKGRLPAALLQNRELMNWLMQREQTPEPLAQLSRRHVRETLGNKLFRQRVQKLGLESKLTDYVLMKEVTTLKSPQKDPEWSSGDRGDPDKPSVKRFDATQQKKPVVPKQDRKSQEKTG